MTSMYDFELLFQAEIRFNTCLDWDFLLLQHITIHITHTNYNYYRSCFYFA